MVRVFAVLFGALVVSLAWVVVSMPGSGTPHQLAVATALPTATPVPTIAIGKDALIDDPDALFVDDRALLTRLLSDVHSGAEVSIAAAVFSYGAIPATQGARVRVLELATADGSPVARVQLLGDAPAGKAPPMMVQSWTLVKWLQPVHDPQP